MIKLSLLLLTIITVICLSSCDGVPKEKIAIDIVNYVTDGGTVYIEVVGAYGNMYSIGMNYPQVVITDWNFSSRNIYREFRGEREYNRERKKLISKYGYTAAWDTKAMKAMYFVKAEVTGYCHYESCAIGDDGFVDIFEKITVKKELNEYPVYFTIVYYENDEIPDITPLEPENGRWYLRNKGE